MTRWTSSPSQTIDAPLQMTAIILLMRPMGPWPCRATILGLATLALILPRVRRSPLTWLAIALCTAVRIADDWPLADNHIYLLGYWCLALAIALWHADVFWAMATGSRWLIGTAFLCAVVWKVMLSPDYLNGLFFRVTLITDPRLTDVTMLVGGLTQDDLARNRQALQPLAEGALWLTPPAILEPHRLQTFARVATWGTLLAEVSVAVAMLWPVASYRNRITPHLALLAFCGVTYAFAPVAGFGWLLVAMGLSQCPDERRVCRGLYVAAFLLVLCYSEVPWAGTLVSWIRS